MIILLILLCLASLYWLYWRTKTNRMDKMTASLPVPPTLPILGNATLFIGDTQKILKNLEDIAFLALKHKGAAKLWLGPKLYVAIGNPEDAQVILDNCLDKDVVYRFLRPWLGHGLFVAPVGLWKSHRKVLLPVFHNKVVEQYLNIISQQADVLVDRLEEQTNKGEFDVLRYVTACTLDIVFETAMGERMDVQHSPDTPYLRARHTVMTILNMRFFKVWLQPDCIFNLTSYSKQQKDNIDLTHKFTDEVVKKRREEYERKKNHSMQEDTGKVQPVLDLLFDREIEFTDEQLREHIDSITIAGNDTTALVIAYTLVLLGIHQDVQEKVFLEQKSIFEDSKQGATKDDLAKMQYLERVLKESMRLYTVVPIIARNVHKDIYLPHCEVTLPAGMGAVVGPFAIHRSKAVWGPDANEFDPDRFLPERSANRHPAAFLPFSYGSRNCIGNITAGNITEKLEAKGLRQCVMSCCLTETCNIIFIADSRCYQVECATDELCLPLPRSGRKWDSPVSMILVKPVLPNENWFDILEQSSYREVSNNNAPEEETLYSPYTSHHSELLTEDDTDSFLSHFIDTLPNMDDDDNGRFGKYRDNADSDMIMDATNYLEKISCDVGAGDCPFNAECVPLSLKTRNGYCKCNPGYEENSQGSCVQILRPYSKGPSLSLETSKKSDETEIKSESTSPKTVQTLTVTVASKTVQLPDNEVTLAAYTTPDEKTTMSHYNYVWTLVDQPKGGFTGNMNQNGATVTLLDLTEGQYRFKVTVNGTTVYGEGYANVTVLPPHRINTPPQVVISPQTQTVRLPNSVAVLDGSASKDDDRIISWHWDLISGPIGYQPPMQDGATLELKDLKLPGNYTFKLTVEDSDHVKNSTTANMTVLNHTDYPPEANAGQDVIIYLPKNNLTLNGSLSTDDHEITSWEWTKSAKDENKAVDMQNTHSPYLQLSNLSEGMYTFVLKVTDSSGQSSSAEVHVFVKPPTNTPPVADAGQDSFISLPQTWMTLNGSGSHDDNRIVSYTWRCLSGSTNSNIVHYNESIANATGLTKGQYVFSLTIFDDNGNSAADNVTVNVAQNKNSPPKADAGGDKVLNLPVPVLILNGSKSSDDFRIVAWKWVRAGSGLAAGTVILNSDTQPVLMLTNIEAGRYVFELTVTDDQGESDRDTVSVQVKPDPLEMNLLEMTLNIPISTFTQGQLDSLVQKMALLLKGDVKMNVTKVFGQVDTGNTQLIFFLTEDKVVMDGSRALWLSRGAARAGAFGAACSVRSLRCLSACSGRGRCDHATHTCRCDAFWMQSLFTQLDPDAMPNCDWSVVYACLGGVAALCGVCACVCACVRAWRRLCAPRKPRARPTYRLLPVADHEDKPFTSRDLSETETESDVLFESKTKTSSFSTRALNGEPQSNGWKKNGHYKNSRKVKT